MSTKKDFITIVDNEIFGCMDVWTENYPDVNWDEINLFWKKFKQTDGPTEITENGKKVLLHMQENYEKMSNLFTSKEIGEALFTSSRSVAGTMRKMVKDGLIEKHGKDPVQYSLTEKGKIYKIN